MVILVASPKAGSGKSTCAVNLACELASLDSAATDRWQGENSVVLVDADAEGTATRCGSGGHLPVSGERLSPKDSQDMERWLRRMEAIVVEVDYVVIDGPSDIDAPMKAMVEISDLVIVPCSVSGADLTAIAPLMELIKTTRSARAAGAPKCLIVPTHTDSKTAPGKDTEAALREFGEPVGPPIQQRVEFAQAFNAGRWIGDFAPKSDAYADIKALAARVDRTVSETKVAVSRP